MRKSQTKRRRLIGMLVISVSGLLLVPPVLVVLTLVLAHMFFHGSYRIMLNSGTALELSVMVMLGAGGMVAAIWLLVGSNPDETAGPFQGADNEDKVNGRPF